MTKFIIIGDNAREQASLALQLWESGDEVVDSFGEAEEWILMPNRFDEDDWRRDARGDGIVLAEAHKEPFAGTTLWRLHYEAPEPELTPVISTSGDALNHDGLYAEAPSTITTWMRKRVDPLAMTPDDFDIDDIAHALARQCRYNGHIPGFLSVARHSVWVSHRLKPFGSTMEMWGLLHDASEAYLGDMVKPLKHDPSMDKFREIEDRSDEQLATAFDLPFPMPAEVHEADRFVTIEMEIGARLKDSHDSTPEEDEDLFLDRYYELVIERMAGD